MAKNRTEDRKPDKASAKPAKAASKAPVKAAKNVKIAPKKENLFSKFRTYLHNVHLEIKRTTWPTKSEVFHMSLVVVGALLFFGVLIFALDSILYTLVDLYAQLYSIIGAGA